MRDQTAVPAPRAAEPSALNRWFKTLLKQKTLIFMSVPFVIWIFIFKYVPLWGWLIAFQHYRPNLTMFQQEWVGLEQFRFLFSDDTFIRVLRNTLVQAVIKLVLGFVTAIVLAILLNEVRVAFFKRAVQTISYLPHFISWVVAANIISTALSIDEGGIVNEVLMWLHIIDQPIMWLGVGHYFWGILGTSEVWKDVGWNTIVYLAAMTMIDPSQYEAAEIDGASRFQRILHITLPGLKPVIVILLIMNLGSILETGFEPQYLMGNGMNADYSENLEIFVLKYGISMGNFSLATAAGIFKTVVSFILLFTANSMAKRFGEQRLF
ncbi:MULTISPECIES: ABC transporter permease subunit [unclassified Paenibacillus]|uniref:ABC transporter permease n=1 Tax=unclassified Paenibacillus TaxID=185978 RepID=UPI0009546EB1|nr:MULTISPECIES: ABC transporter permease subunit [unclassified Paenibacillus]ASS64957.1 sugar ABC transporter permease [Paenibacillus sp. RUD330]SIR00055.1 putative aldouronate transport system permease protein [Paenibacillus sp. RU4X]SIR34732.1 putative aldouronate transport system permease protein [Paenibacillus sp. RU4T]